MARFFVNRPIVAMVISIITVLLGAVVSPKPAAAAPAGKGAAEPATEAK